MTPPKDYAKELVDKFYRYVPADEEYEHEYAKQCALLAVNEMIEWTEFDVISDWPNQRYIDKLNYLDEVKKEIELL
jgi:hypothetical protein